MTQVFVPPPSPLFCCCLSGLEILKEVDIVTGLELGSGRMRQAICWLLSSFCAN